MKKKKSPLKNRIKEMTSDIRDNLSEDVNSKSYFNILEVIIIIFISILFGIIVGYIITYSRSGDDDNLEEIITTYNSIVEDYYDNVDKNKLSDAAIKGMVESLDDPYSNYMDSNTTSDFNETIDGSFVGIGVTIVYENDYNTVIALEDRGPAKKAGIEIGDVILAVDGKDVKGVWGDDLTKLIRGKSQTKVKLLIKRDEEEKEISVKRDVIEIQSVTGNQFDYEGSSAGYVKIKSFSANTAKQFTDELTRLEKKKVDFLVIDVRDNPGGHLTQVKEILSLFFDKKTVLYQIETKNSKKKVYSLNNKKRNYPVAVLINGSSASASEILAATFKENYKNSVIVGKTSYGKGTVQKSKSLEDGNSIKYTTQKWLTSKGKSISKKGVKPDLDVDLNDEYYSNPNYNNDNQLQEALNKIKEMK